MTAADDAIEVARKEHRFLFEDSFLIKTVDNTRFERAARIDCESVAFDNNVELDVNNHIYPVHPGDTLHMAITPNVSPADNPRHLSNAFEHDPRILGPSILDHFEYVMYGKCYKKVDDKKKNAATVFVSHGGMLMKLQSDTKQLQDFHVGDCLYLLVRKVDMS
eukprot:TRINITY_DN67055_c0_g1_i1.p1 TRINITY_DN67055_c0_g1~~TRINITY_DN67055_c0_g1_i1.p1  ORF type:complete len:177 (-),score=37.57 TRINITY_DN67055_c0_g1_i1:83-571(-)